MTKEIYRNILRTKNRVNFAQAGYLAEQMKFWAIDRSVIDEKLLSEHVEVIRLEYDRIRTWLTIKSAGFVGFLVLLINNWGNILLTLIFVIALIFSTTGAVVANKRYNIIFNTLIKKLQTK